MRPSLASLSHSPRVQCHPILMVSVSTAGPLLRVTSILSPASRDIPSPPPKLVSSQATRRFLPLIPELSNQRWHYQTSNASRGSLPPCHPRAFVSIISHATRGSSLPSPAPSQTTEGSLPLATKSPFRWCLETGLNRYGWRNRLELQPSLGRVNWNQTFAKWDMNKFSLLYSG